MSREKWKLIKRKKGFYVGTYRRIENILMLSVLLNVILALCVIQLRSSQAENKFYATNGVSAPQELTPMDQSNVTSAPLLPDDPIDDQVDKVIPQ